jgi:hypothetical protein
VVQGASGSDTQGVSTPSIKVPSPSLYLGPLSESERRTPHCCVLDMNVSTSYTCSIILTVALALGL